MAVNLVERMEGFVPNATYCFDPPVETKCILVNGQGGWKEKFFSEGWCLKFENGEGVFQGKPLDEKNIHYFKVTYGSGGSEAIKKAKQKI